MKFESLENSKFSAFKGCEINNPLAISGGAEVFWDKTQVTCTDAQGNSSPGVDKFEWGPGARTKDESVPNPAGGTNQGDTVMSSCGILEREPGFTYTIDVMWGLSEPGCF